MITQDWRKLWIVSLVLAGLFGFGYGWKQARDNPMRGMTKIIEPPEVKLLKKGRYDEAAKAILDSIKDEKKDSWRYQSVAAVYYARAQNEPTQIGDSSSQPCPYYEKATVYAQSALAQLKSDSIFAGDEKIPTEPIRKEIEKHTNGLNDKTRTKCLHKP